MSPDLCTDLSYPWLILQRAGSVCRCMCVLAVFTGVCRFPGSLQVSVSIIQRAERSEPAEAMSAVCNFGWLVCPQRLGLSDCYVTEYGKVVCLLCLFFLYTDTFPLVTEKGHGVFVPSAVISLLFKGMKQEKCEVTIFPPYKTHNSVGLLEKCQSLAEKVILLLHQL